MNENEKVEQSSTKDRILEFIAKQDISVRKFEEVCGLSNGYINNIRKSIKSETFDKQIKPNFPQLNKLWLLHGAGHMLNEDEVIKVGDSENTGLSFYNLELDKKLDLIYNQNSEISKNIEMAEIRNKIRSEINRVYLKAIIVQLGLDEIIDEEISTLEKELNKISSN